MAWFDSSRSFVQIWEMQLRVRRKACEGRLADLRERHGNIVLLRRRHPEMGPSWHKKDDLLAWLRHLIKRELGEIYSVNMLLRVGPIAGNKVVLWTRNGVTGKVSQGPSIIDLINEQSEHFEQTGLYEDSFIKQGLDIALDVIANPYKYLTEEMRERARAADEQADAIIMNRAGVGEHTSKALPPAGKPQPTLAQVRAETANKDMNVVVRRGKQK